MFTTEQEAQEYADTKYPGAKVYQDKKSRQYFVALNEDGNAAYTTGATVTRDFGPNNPYIISSNAFNTGVSAFSIGHSAKSELLVHGLDGARLGLYSSVTTGIGYATVAINSGFASYNAYKYYTHGGQDLRVYYKYILDIAFGALAVASVGTPLAPVVIFATAAYLFVDLYTNGFGFDYSVPEPIFFPD